MFGLSYETSVVIVGVVMLAYVLFGGMIATTWVQIVKACLLLAGAVLLSILSLAQFGFNPLTLFDAAAAKYGEAVLAPGKLVTDPWEAVSLGLALMFGTAGLPHILMRFYTVPDAKAARQSVFWATGLIGFFYLMTFILGFGAAVLVGRAAITGVDAGGNMAAPLLAEALGAQDFSASSRRSRSRRSSQSWRGSHSRARRRSATIFGSMSCARANRTPRKNCASRAGPPSRSASSRSCSGSSLRAERRLHGGARLRHRGVG